MAFEWTPAKSLAACDALLQAPGSPFELEPVVVGPRRFRAFKHLPRSLRDFFESTKVRSGAGNRELTPAGVWTQNDPRL